MIQSRKGAGVSQVFIFIITALTIALILIFGYKAIAGFLERGEEVQFYQFKVDLEKSIRQIYTEFGSVRQQQFHLPLRYTQICFIDLDALYDPSLCPSSRARDQIACDAWEDAGSYDHADENVFLTPSAPVKIKVHLIRMETPLFCLNLTRGTFTLVMEGKGSYTFLSAAEGEHS